MCSCNAGAPDYSLNDLNKFPDTMRCPPRLQELLAKRASGPYGSIQFIHASLGLH